MISIRCVVAGCRIDVYVRTAARGLGQRRRGTMIDFEKDKLLSFGSCCVVLLCDISLSYRVVYFSYLVSLQLMHYSEGRADYRTGIDSKVKARTGLNAPTHLATDRFRFSCNLYVGRISIRCFARLCSRDLRAS